VSGRYAYGNQPRIAAWNLARLAEALLPLLGPSQDAAIESAKEAIAGFASRFESAYLIGLRRKLGLEAEQEGDGELAQDLLRHMQEGGADWTLTFHALADAVEGNDAPARALFSPGAAWDAWAERWTSRLAREPGAPAERAAMMRARNPLYIPRNHLVEAALDAATQSGDYRPFEELLGVITKPYERRSGLERFAQPPRPDERVLATFCGT
jgi:serine/tyrosine/threonine adenylyltransferase